MVDVELITRQISSLLEKYNVASGYADESPEGWNTKDLKALLTSFQAIIERAAPSGSAYIVNCHAVLADEHSGEGYKLECLAGIAEALRDDYFSGTLASIHELIRAEVFDDFIEMAEHLLESGYKDAAAVLIGGVLEGELKKLAQRIGVPVLGSDGRPLKSDGLNAAVAARGMYNKLDQKSVTSWLDLRNKAAHAEYASYTIDHVRVMLAGVRHFVSRMTQLAV